MKKVLPHYTKCFRYIIFSSKWNVNRIGYGGSYQIVTESNRLQKNKNVFYIFYGVDLFML